VSVDGAGNVSSIDAGNDRIRIIPPNGVIDTVAGPVNTPSNAAVDGAGNRYVADCCRIQRITPAGVVTTVATFPPDPPYLKEAFGPLSCGSDLCGKTMIRSVAVDPPGNVYFTNATNVFRLSTDGSVTTIAGNGTYGYSGDGGMATAAQLSFPAGIAVDEAGNIYIADAGNNAVRVLTIARQPASLSTSHPVVTQGECFAVTAGNGSGMTLDVQYRHEKGPVQTIRGWPVLDQDGKSQICTDLKTATGSYVFTAIRNSITPGWVSVHASLTVRPKVSP
jgi:sugar lactone lactonase YvrE